MDLVAYRAYIAGLGITEAPDNLVAPADAGGIATATAVVTAYLVIDHRSGQVALLEGGKPGSVSGFLAWVDADGSVWWEGSDAGASTYDLHSPAIGTNDLVVVRADGTTATIFWNGGRLDLPQGTAFAGGNASTWGSTGSGGTSPNGAPVNINGTNAVLTDVAGTTAALSDATVQGAFDAYYGAGGEAFTTEAATIAPAAPSIAGTLAPLVATGPATLQPAPPSVSGALSPVASTAVATLQPAGPSLSGSLAPTASTAPATLAPAAPSISGSFAPQGAAFVTLAATLAPAGPALAGLVRPLVTTAPATLQPDAPSISGTFNDEQREPPASIAVRLLPAPSLRIALRPAPRITISLLTP